MGPGRTEQGAGGKVSHLIQAELIAHGKPGKQPEDKLLSPEASVKEYIWDLTRRGNRNEN